MNYLKCSNNFASDCTLVLHTPSFTKEFIVQTDSSDVGMGVVLNQVNGQGKKHPILCLSKKLSDLEKRYSTTEKNAIALFSQSKNCITT